VSVLPGISAVTESDGEGAARSPRGNVTASQHARIVRAMVDVVGERGYAGAAVGLVVARAKVSPRTFYEAFDGLQDCFLAVIDEETERAAALVAHAFERETAWREGLRSALTSLLVFLDSEPVLARIWLVEVLAAGSWALERRERNLSRLTRLIVSAWTVPDGWRPPPLAAEGVMTSVLGVLHNHLVARGRDPLISLLGPLIGIVMRPYLDPQTVAREIERGETLAEEIQAGRPWPLPTSADPRVEIPALLAHPGAHRARQCLLYLARNPGVSNRHVATAIGVDHLGQVSTLLTRLAKLGLLNKRAGSPGRPNAWRLTPMGARVAASLEQPKPIPCKSTSDNA
jgi:AcrR family transcriptional regulator